MSATDPATFCDSIRGRLVGSLTLYCGDRMVAEEIAQEALLRAWQRWEQVGTLDSPEAWTFKVARNLARSTFRRRRLERRARSQPAPDRSVDSDTAEAVAVRAAVAALPERQRATIVARFYLDLSVASTAEALGCAEGTVKATTHQAIAALRAEGLNAIEDDETDERIAP